jgi:hypothetical protein
MASALISTQATILPFSSSLAALGFRGKEIADDLAESSDEGGGNPRWPAI